MARVTALDVAAYMIQLANEIDENDLTNLKLQKLLYFAQGRYLAKTGTPLFDEEIEAWQYGPVVRSVYNEYKSCGAFPITLFDLGSDYQELPEDIKTFVKAIWDEYGRFSAGYLVNLTHEQGTPWSRHFQSSGGGVIPKDELRRYFQKNA